MDKSGSSRENDLEQGETTDREIDHLCKMLSTVPVIEQINIQVIVINEKIFLEAGNLSENVNIIFTLYDLFYNNKITFHMEE